MGLKGVLKSIQAAERRQQREAQRRFRELERQLKEQARLSAIEQAKLEVQAFESGLEVLLSVHKEQGPDWNWIDLASALPPHCPRKLSTHTVKARLRGVASTDEAQTQDDCEFQKALEAFNHETAQWERMKSIACRILGGEPKAYIQALTEFNSLTELSDLGSELHFTVHTKNLIECRLKVNGRHAIPNELKTLTASGKLSVKPMPKARFHEIYQDYVCSCILRVAREVFALLPINDLLVTALVDAIDTRTGHAIVKPVLSAAVSRIKLRQLDFDHLDPSDALQGFLHRGDAKASRKSGEFEEIVPLTPTDLNQSTPERLNFPDLLTAVRRLREEIRTEFEKLSSKSEKSITLVR